MSVTTALDDLPNVLAVALSRRSRLRRGVTREEHVRYEAAKNQVFFYADCGADWSPLLRFAGRCDTFVYCDAPDRSGVEGIPNRDTIVGNLREAAAQVPRRVVVDHVVSIPLDFITAMAQPGGVPEGAAGLPRVEESWGFLASLRCTATKRPKRLHLLYFRVEPLTLYSNLFIERSHGSLKRAWAPEYLCVRSKTRGFGGGLAYLNTWNDTFSNLVMGHSVKPKYLMGGDGHWPWNVTWLTLPFWNWTGSVEDGGGIVLHRPEHLPTIRETNDFRLPGLPEREWPTVEAH